MGVVSCVIAAALAGCGASAGERALIPPLVIGIGQNHRTVDMTLGRRLTVRLEMLWAFGPPSGRAVTEQGYPRLIRVTHGCKSVIGCGFVELHGVAVRRGRSVITATRRNCGEDIRCVPPQTFSVTVIVS